MHAAPAVSCAVCTKECAHEHTGSAEAIRHSLRNGLTAYSALSPATNSFCHRHRRISGFAKPGRARKDLRRFSTSNGCQNHTTSPYASAPFVWRAVPSLTSPKDPPCDDDRARRCRVHRIPCPTLVTIAKRPSAGRDGGSCTFDLPVGMKENISLRCKKMTRQEIGRSSDLPVEAIWRRSAP
jgi:hypothetical protein